MLWTYIVNGPLHYWYLWGMSRKYAPILISHEPVVWPWCNSQLEWIILSMYEHILSCGVTQSTIRCHFMNYWYYGTIIFTVNIYQILLQTWTFIHEYYPNDSEGFQGYSMSEILMKLLYWCFKLARNPLKAIYIL